MRHVPKFGDMLPVVLGNETARSIVQQVSDDGDEIVVHLTFPILMAKEHPYRKDEYVLCRRTRDMFGERWVAQKKMVIEDDTQAGERRTE